MASSSTSSLYLLTLGIWRLTSTNPRQGMAAPPVPSSSNNRPRGWISRSNSSHNFALMVDTCAPKSTKAVTLHPSTTTSASLARPTNCATGSGFRNGMDSMFFCPLCFSASFWVSCGSGLQRECFVFMMCDWRGV